MDKMKFPKKGAVRPKGPSNVEEAGSLMHGATSIKLVIVLFVVYCVIGFQLTEEIRNWLSSKKGMSPTLPAIALAAIVLLALGIVGVIRGRGNGKFIGMGSGAWGALLFFGMVGGAGAKLFTLMGGRL